MKAPWHSGTIFFSPPQQHRTSHNAQHVTATQYLLSDGATTSPRVHFISHSRRFRPPCIVRAPRNGKDRTVASIPSQMKRRAGEIRGNDITWKHKSASSIHFFFLFPCPSPFYLLHKCTDKVRLCGGKGERGRFRTTLAVQEDLEPKCGPISYIMGFQGFITQAWPSR